MSRLLSLPPEILGHIIEGVLPQDLDNFCRCCPELEQFAEVALKRHEDMKNFSQIACGIVPDHRGQSRVSQQSITILRDILKTIITPITLKNLQLEYAIWSA